MGSISFIQIFKFWVCVGVVKLVGERGCDQVEEEYFLFPDKVEEE